MYYAGIGSRETPEFVLNYFMRLGQWMAEQGFILRSGHADGADRAFENGCDIASGKKEIYLPWKKFNNSTSELYLANINNPMAYDIAAKFHPKWYNLKDTTKKMMARNSHQVLGFDLNTPTELVLCWTKGGKDLGGTSQAIRVARAYGIKIINAGGYDDLSKVSEEITNFLALRAS